MTDSNHPPIVITTAQFRAVLLATLDHMEQCGNHAIEIRGSYYWHIDSEARYNHRVAPSPESMSLGDLADDWTEIMARANGEKEPFGYSLVWLSAILRRFGEDLPA